jgi:hypothetical protein
MSRAGSIGSTEATGPGAAAPGDGSAARTAISGQASIAARIPVRIRRRAMRGAGAGKAMPRRALIALMDVLRRAGRGRGSGRGASTAGGEVAPEAPGAAAGLDAAVTPPAGARAREAPCARGCRSRGRWGCARCRSRDPPDRSPPAPRPPSSASRACPRWARSAGAAPEARAARSLRGEARGSGS